MFKYIKSEALKTSKDLARDRGNCPDSLGDLSRNCHLLAIAPNASSSIICGGTSPSIEPIRATFIRTKLFPATSKSGTNILKKQSRQKNLRKKK